ncbi:helix-turn-helix domain-containing protein [Clostridium manihotivorum]|uniref:Helix-turn-helix domain-containing protein n=1 Tax=Clostridium manihotivorum TaxID=2320868 RepID=A0A3R5TG82_9CLOT|nr:helix-turn-helix domain-containing protein [Clostridium manihotivorum]QAA32756.1 helix-turn-helix domain-containing protein [Clostridium manihotivorum]
MKKNELLDQVYKSNLPSRAKQIMFYLINRSNAEGTCFPSVKTIASDCGISARTVQRTMTIILQEGFIKKDSRFREKGGQTSNLYTLCCPSETSEGVDDKELNIKEEKVEDNCNENNIKMQIVTFDDYTSSDDLISEIINEDLLKEDEPNHNGATESSYRDDRSCIPTEYCSIFKPFKRIESNWCFLDNYTIVQCRREGDSLQPP